MWQSLPPSGRPIIGLRCRTLWAKVRSWVLKKTHPDLIIILGGGSIIDRWELARLFGTNDVPTDDDWSHLQERFKVDFGRETDPEDLWLQQPFRA